MEGEGTYESLGQNTINETNAYELCQVSGNQERRAEQPKNIKEPTRNKPIIIIIIVLLSLIVILLVGILCLLLVHMSTRDTTCTAGATTGAIAGNNGYPNFTQWANDIVFRVNQSLHDFNESANAKVVNTLSNLQDTSTSTAGVVDDILLIAQELLVLHNDSTALPTSCKEIKERQPLSPSGYYILVALNGGTYETYCNMGILCGSGRGWTRLAYLDMTDATQNCPSGFRLYQSGGVRACGRPVTNNGSCVSVQFPSNGISYSQICGRVTGYQYRSPDAAVRSDINSYYVDGVSITRGSPRQHVWTFINGYSDSYNINNCNCNQQPQAFIGNNYFCESGNPNSNANRLFISDPLWDGQNCGSNESTCCSATGIPWFHRDYGSTTTTDYIELRVCGDQVTADEDSPVGFYEIYIK